MADVVGVLALLHQVPGLSQLDDKSLLSLQWSTLELILSRLFSHSSSLSDLSTFISQRQSDRSLERLHPTPSSLALARDREGLYRQLLTQLLHTHLHSSRSFTQWNPLKVNVLLDDPSISLRVLHDLARSALGLPESSPASPLPASPSPPASARKPRSDPEPKTKAKPDSAEKKRSSKPSPTSPPPKPGPPRRSDDPRRSDSQPREKPRADVRVREKERVRDRVVDDAKRREEDEKMSDMREMMRRKAAEEKRDERKLPPPPQSPPSPPPPQSRPATSAPRRPLRPSSPPSSSALQAEQAKSAALQQRLTALEATIAALDDDADPQRLARLQAQNVSLRRQLGLVWGLVQGKRAVVGEVRLVLEALREVGRRGRGRAGEEEGEEALKRRLAEVVATVGEVRAVAEEAMKRVDALDLHSNTLGAGGMPVALYGGEVEDEVERVGEAVEELERRVERGEGVREGMNEIKEEMKGLRWAVRGVGGEGGRGGASRNGGEAGRTEAAMEDCERRGGKGVRENGAEEGLGGKGRRRLQHDAGEWTM